MRLHIIVEGQTEETFVNETLAPHLAGLKIVTDARRVMTSRSRSKIHRGGTTTYHKARFDVTQWLKQESDAEQWFTTMFDYYALPNDFPGHQAAQKLSDPYKRVEAIEDAFGEDIDDYRFIPYIQLHEFEALLFTEIQQMEWAFIDHEPQIEALIRIAHAHENPEMINLKPETAPSKRIIKAIPEYGARKSAAGPLVANKIGIAKMRSKCPHFDEWITKLEELSQVQPEQTGNEPTE